MLGAVTFVVVAGEMLPTAVLPFMAADLGVPPPQVGLLVSLWAAVVVIASFPLVHLTAHRDRRRTVAAALVVLGGASLVTALAPSFAVALGSRLVAAAACGLLWATINAYTAAVAPERRLGQAVAVVLGGGTLGSVVAVPAANAMAETWDWRGTFAAVAVLAVAGAVAVVLVVAPGADDGGPPVARRRAASPWWRRAAVPVRSGLAAVRAGAVRGPGGPAGAGRAVLVLATAGGILLAGHFAAFTFVTTLLEASPAGIGTLLIVFGVASGLAVVLAGRVADAEPDRLFLADAAVLAVSLLALAAAGRWTGLDVMVVALWGLAGGAVGPLAQTAIMRSAGPALRATAGTTIPVVFNLGIAVGAASGSGAVDRLGPGALPWLAGGMALTAAALLGAVGAGPAVRGGARDGRTVSTDPAVRPAVLQRVLGGAGPRRRKG